MRYAALIVAMLTLAACASDRLPAPRAGEAEQPEETEYVPKEADPNPHPLVPDRTSDDLLSEADSQFSAREYANALKLYEQAVESAEFESSNSNLTEALAQSARMNALLSKWEDGRAWLKKAAKVATGAEPKGWSRYLGVRGRFEWQDQKDNAKAKTTFVEMYEYCGRHKLLSRRLDAAHMVAIVAPPAEQVEWALKSIKAAEDADEKGWLAVLWNNLGWTYDEQGEYAKMLEALINARKYHHEVGNDHSKLVADFGVGRAHWRNGNFDTAREWVETALKTAVQRYEADPENTGKAEWVGWGNVYLGDIAVTEEKPAEALELFKKGRPFLIKAGIENWWAEGLKEVDDKIAKLEVADE